MVVVVEEEMEEEEEEMERRAKEERSNQSKLSRHKPNVPGHVEHCHGVCSVPLGL